jgi:hypothetical protein
MDLEYLIDRLEELLDRSTRIPATSRVILNEDEFLRLVDQMRVSVPQEVRNARQIEADRDAILAAAQEQAEAMISTARGKADELVSEHALVAQAQARAEQIVADAYDEGADIRADADAYALEVLERIAGQLDGFRRTVENGIQLLRAGHRAGRGDSQAPPASPAERIEPSVVGGLPAEGGIAARTAGAQGDAPGG